MIPPIQPDLDYIKKELRAFQKNKNISSHKIGEILGSTAKYKSGKAFFARHFFEDPEYNVSVKQVMDIAKFMERDPVSLLFHHQGAFIHSQGENTMNAVSLNHGDVTQNSNNDSHTLSEKDIIAYLNTCDEKQLEDLKAFIEFVQIKQKSNSAKKK